MVQPDIAIIINSFNRLALLKECLGVLSSWLPESELSGRCGAVIYEAGSSDGSLQWLQDQMQVSCFPLYIVTPAPGDDTSFSAGLNAGVAFVEKQFSALKYLLFYETDNQVLSADPLLKALVMLERRHDLAACGFTVLKHDGHPAGAGQPFPSLLNFALGKNIVQRFQLEAIPYKWQTNEFGIEFSEVDVVYTSPLLVRLDAWRQSGGLDSRNFPFCDCDVDWARRIYNLGWRMGVINTCLVIHDNRETISAWSKTRVVHTHRGRLKYFRRYHPFGVFAVWPVLLLLRHGFELLATKLLVKEPERRGRLYHQVLFLLKSCRNNYN